MGKWGQICSLIHELKPVLMMLLVQVAFAGVSIFYKLAANDGMNLRVIIAYRLIFASAFMVPVALFLERNRRPKLTLKILFLGFLSGLFGGSLCQNLFAESLVLTSATFSTAMFNLIPAVTFVLAVSIGLEKLGLKTRAGKAKVLGTLIGISGAMLLTFYKGVEIKIWSTHIDLLSHVSTLPLHSHSHSAKHLLGSLLALASCFTFALWLIIQAKISEEYPCQYSSIALMCVMGAIQAVVFGLCMETDWEQWKLGWNIRLLTVAYSGIVSSGLMATVTSWCVHLKGPLFASVFSPVMLVVVAIAASLFLNEKLHLGSLLGAILIVFGLYMVLWGRAEEMKKIIELVPASRESESIEMVIISPNEENDSNRGDQILPKENTEINKGDRDYGEIRKDDNNTEER